MDIKNLFTRYGAFARVRVSKNQKIRFLTTLLSEFREMGFSEGKMYKTNYKQKLSVIGVIGDIHRSDYLYVTYYDTPVKNFIKTEYMPFDDKQLKERARRNYLIPMFSASVVFVIYVAKILVPVLQNGVQNFWEILAVILSFLLMIFLAKIVQYSGIPSRDTLERNTSSVVTLINLADKLTKEQKKSVSFAFVDFGTVNYLGYHILKELIGDQKCKVIFLDTVSEGKLTFSKRKNIWLDDNFENPMYVYGKKTNQINDISMVEGVNTTTKSLLRLLK